MLTPIRLVGPDQGLCFDRAAGHLYRPSYVDSEGQVLQWDPSFASLIRRSPLADFLADPAYSEHGARVVFTRMEGGREVLADTLGLDQGAKLPRSLHRRLRLAEQRLQAMRGTGRLTPEEEQFLTAFRLPDVAAFPSAYRVKKAGVFSSRRLYVLWGLVPEQARATPTIMIGWGNAAEAGAGSEGGAMGGGQSSGATDEGQWQVVYDDSLGWPKWLEWLVAFLALAVVLVSLWLLFSMLSPGCEASRDEVHPAKRIPSLAEQKKELVYRIDKLREEVPALADEKDPRRLRLRALGQAQILGAEAERDERSAADAADKARRAEARSKETGSEGDIAQATELRKDADAKKREADESAAAAGRAFLSPQEQLRKQELAQNERYKEISRQAEEAKKAADVSGLADDRTKANDFQQEAESARRSLPGLPLSPGAEKDLRDKLYVTPNSSRESGEVVVRRFKADELVAKKGIKLHLEADGNGRKDFKVKGWAFGVSTMIKEERLEGFVPVGPGLSIDTPLDLYFEYRGEDGQMHEDCAPFVITGDIEFRLSLEIEHAKGDSPPPPPVKPIPGA